jgi:hypothetical protein
MRTAALFALVLLLAGCHEEHAKLKVLQITEKAKAKNPNAGLTTERDLADVGRVEVTDFADHPHFFVLARTPNVKKYPCTACHTVALEQMRGAPGSAKRAHWDVKLQHAPATVMTCATCHAQNGSLHTLQGAPVDFDHSYRLCAQCHARQAQDWAAGAHGKRAAGWAPPRVVMACVQCHNPHQPRWDTRWPAVVRRPQ